MSLYTEYLSLKRQLDYVSNYKGTYEITLPYDFSNIKSFPFMTEGFNSDNAIKGDWYKTKDIEVYLTFSTVPTPACHVFTPEGRCLGSFALSNYPEYTNHRYEAVEYTLLDASIAYGMPCPEGDIPIICLWQVNDCAFDLAVLHLHLDDFTWVKVNLFPFPTHDRISDPYKVGIPLLAEDAIAKPIYNPGGVLYSFPDFNIEPFFDYIKNTLVVGNLQSEYCSVHMDSGYIIGTIGSIINVSFGPFLSFPFLLQYIYFIDLIGGKNELYPICDIDNFMVTTPVNEHLQPVIKSMSLVENNYILLNTDVISRILELKFVDVAGDVYDPTIDFLTKYPESTKDWEGGWVGGVYYPTRKKEAPHYPGSKTTFIGYPTSFTESSILDYKIIAQRWRLLNITDMYVDPENPCLPVSLPNAPFVYIPTVTDPTVKYSSRFNHLLFPMDTSLAKIEPYHIGIYKPGTCSPRLDSFYIPGLVPNKQHTVPFRLFNHSLSGTMREISIDYTKVPEGINIVINNMPDTLAPQTYVDVNLVVTYTPPSYKEGVTSDSFPICFNYFLEFYQGNPLPTPTPLQNRSLQMKAPSKDYTTHDSGALTTVDTWDIQFYPEDTKISFKAKAFGVPDRFVVEYPVGTIVYDGDWLGEKDYVVNNPDIFIGDWSGLTEISLADIVTKVDGSDTIKITVHSPMVNSNWEYSLHAVLPPEPDPTPPTP